MAALLLSFAGASAGGALFGAAGAIAGRLAGAVAGSVLDGALFGPPRKKIEGPRLSDLDVMGSSEGAAIPRVYGRVRVAGQVIWATRLEEVVETRKESAGGGKGGGARVTTTTYSYFANFAVALCAGEVAHVGRIWADGKPLDRERATLRIYRGDETQEPDPLILAKEPDGIAPAYRGLCYLVFERLALADFGNRLPQIGVEVIRPVGRLETMIRAVALIPGATEFGYEPEAVTRSADLGVYAPENRHVLTAASDWAASLDELQALCPNLERVALVVTWFGDDLRAGHCTIRPKVVEHEKTNHGGTWSVAGLSRAAAQAVSQHDGRPAFGGTPSDASVIRAIQDLHARGLEVTFYPFVMMDVAADNTLPDPYTGETGQPAYPWRGQITCDPAPSREDTVDGTPAAADQVAALFGACEAADFSHGTGDVTFSGAEEWSLRRMILHYASLCEAAGGVDAFLIGSEMEALTRVRSASGVYPATAELISLAEQVSAILSPGTKLSYAANWTELAAHTLDPSGDEIRFPLDPLWAAPEIDFVGVDYYAPLADWRDGSDHLDAANHRAIYEHAYLRGNLRGGEAFDFFYANDAARLAQTRTPITDGAYGKPWIHRAKDLWHWWAEPHVERAGGVELAEPTAWLPQSKPVRFTETGCPAVDKGANQPNVFPDEKSALGGFPYFSNRRRDDQIQRRYLQTFLAAFDPALGASEDDNPVSAITGERMVEASATHPWAWDARPYPAFPLAEHIWADGANWEIGHWLNGRLGGAPLAELIEAIAADFGLEGCDASQLTGTIDGYCIDRPMSARAAIEPLARAFGFDAFAEEALIRFRMRGGAPAATIAEDDMAVEDERAACRFVRAQESELPAQVAIGYTEIRGDFRRAAVLSRRLNVESTREARAELAVVASDAAIERAAEIWLRDIWAARERAEFALPPSALALMPGDIVDLDVRGRLRRVEITEIADAGARGVTARGIDPEHFELAARPPRRASIGIAPAAGPPAIAILDLPLDPRNQPALQYCAAHVQPWPGGIAIWRSADGESFERIAIAETCARMGITLDPLAAGPAHRWDRGNEFRVRLASGALSALPDLRVLEGGNATAIRSGAGPWEILQFAGAELVGERTWQLSRLLRGQQGTEHAILDRAAGASFVLLDGSAIRDCARTRFARQAVSFPRRAGGR